MTSNQPRIRYFVSIRSTLNNTLLVLTDRQGLILAWTSAGSVGFKGARRASSYAAQQAGLRLASKCRPMSSISVRLKGFGPGRDAALKGLKLGGVRISKIEDRTSVPHNGCRPPKKRRF